MTKEEAHVLPSLPVIMDQTIPPLDYDLPYQRFVNPTNLRVVDSVCGECHAEKVATVKKSMMAYISANWKKLVLAQIVGRRLAETVGINAFRPIGHVDGKVFIRRQHNR